MKSKIIYLIIFYLIFSGLNSFTDAQRRFNKFEMPPPPHLLEELKLTAAQKDKIEELIYNHQKQMIELRSELQQKLLEMKKLRSSSELSRSKLINITKEINEIRNEISLARVNHQMDIYELLDETQRKIWNDNRPFNFGRNFGKFRNWRNCW